MQKGMQSPEHVTRSPGPKGAKSKLSFIDSYKPINLPHCPYFYFILYVFLQLVDSLIHQRKTSYLKCLKQNEWNYLSFSLWAMYDLSALSDFSTKTSCGNDV